MPPVMPPGLAVWWILDDDGNPVCVDIETFARWDMTTERTVARDFVGSVELSTVFTGINYAFHGGPPVLWETMIFGGEFDGYGRRYTSADDARRGHAEAIAKVMASLN